MDSEGAEGRIFTGGQQLLQTVDVVLFEIGETWCVDNLKILFRPVLVNNGPTQVPYAVNLECSGCSNVLGKEWIHGIQIGC